ncbi:MAG: 3-oxoacyl-[acyl-carrier-protein] synthase III C-terminal domain-containing protein [Anaerolineales bacterium]
MSFESSNLDVDFYHRPNTHTEIIQVGKGVPFGYEVVQNQALGISGVYGAWGESVDNSALKEQLAHKLGDNLKASEVGELDELGFTRRHILPPLKEEEYLELELEVGARLLTEAYQANGWKAEEVEGVIIGMSAPITEDYVDQICQRAKIPEDTLKVSVHKACDGSVAGLHLALNPNISPKSIPNIAQKLFGKKVLIGGIEGLSRFLRFSKDVNALQLFGNGAGIIGVIPGINIKYLTGATRAVFDEEGVLQVRMAYPHSRETMLEMNEFEPNHIRVAGMMHEPQGDDPISMAGMMGMVKLFIRNGVQIVTEVYNSYKLLLQERQIINKDIAVAIIHHANYKINKLKEKHLNNANIHFSMPWLVHDFGNVSAASNMIAFLRWLPNLKPTDHVLFDGFGAGTFYDALAVELTPNE